jgi:hypothetical protein
MLINGTRTARLVLLGSAVVLGALTYSGTADAQYYRRWGHPGWYQRWPGTCWNCGFVPGVAFGVGIGALATAPYAYAPYYYPPPAYYAAPYPYYYEYYGYPDQAPGYVSPGSG